MSKAADVLQEGRIQQTLTNAVFKVKNEIEEHLKALLKRKGISEEEWRMYGECSVVGNCNIYSFNHKPIFKTFFPEVKFEPGVTEGKVSIYYEELD